MSILIKGTEMPKSYKDIRIYADGRVVSKSLHTYGEEIATAVPVPEPHGRLIEADAMLMRINHEVMEAYMDGVCYGVHPSQEHLYLLGEIIDDSPTIIPASEEG